MRQACGRASSLQVQPSRTLFRKLFHDVLIVGFAALASPACWMSQGQTLDTAILGIISDPTGSAIVGATVTNAHSPPPVSRVW